MIVCTIWLLGLVRERGGCNIELFIWGVLRLVAKCFFGGGWRVLCGSWFAIRLEGCMV